MFISMMKDEKEYGEALGRIAEGLRIRPADVADMMIKARAIIERRGEKLLRKIKDTTDEVEAVNIAMELEKQNIELCERLSKGMKEPKKKAFLAALLREERRLYSAFANTGLFLSDPDIWFMWDERSIMDGGTVWA